jgi:hypothetical protein
MRIFFSFFFLWGARGALSQNCEKLLLVSSWLSVRNNHGVACVILRLGLTITEFGLQVAKMQRCPANWFCVSSISIMVLKRAECQTFEIPQNARQRETLSAISVKCILNRANLAAQKDLHHESSSTGHKVKRVNPFCIQLTEILGKLEMFQFQKERD